MGALKLSSLIQNHTDGNYNDLKVDSYISEQMRRVSVMNLFYEESLNKHEPQVSVYISADIPRAILMEKFVFVLYLSILPDIQVDTYSNYAAGDLSEWYN